MDIITLLIGIVFLFKRIKVKRIKRESFQNIEENDFQKWKIFELERHNIFLKIIWIWIAITFIILTPIVYYANLEYDKTTSMTGGFISGLGGVITLVLAFTIFIIKGRNIKKEIEYFDKDKGSSQFSNFKYKCSKCDTEFYYKGNCESCINCGSPLLTIVDVNA